MSRRRRSAEAHVRRARANRRNSAAKRKPRRTGRVDIGARFTFSSCTRAVSDAILS